MPSTTTGNLLAGQCRRRQGQRRDLRNRRGTARFCRRHTADLRIEVAAMPGWAGSGSRSPPNRNAAPGRENMATQHLGEIGRSSRRTRTRCPTRSGNRWFAGSANSTSKLAPSRWPLMNMPAPTATAADGSLHHGRRRAGRVPLASRRSGQQARQSRAGVLAGAHSRRPDARRDCRRRRAKPPESIRESLWPTG